MTSAYSPENKIKAARLTAMLSTEELIESAKSVDVGVLELLLDELGKRLSGKELIAACKEVHANLV